jgi:hypothetical protein
MSEFDLWLSVLIIVACVATWVACTRRSPRDPDGVRVEDRDRRRR